LVLYQTYTCIISVLSVVKKWVDRHYYDFENDIMREKLNNFINEIKNSDYSIVADQLRNFIAQNV